MYVLNAGPKPPIGGSMDQISSRTLLLVLVGTATAYLILHNPPLGAALGTAVTLVALLHDLLEK
ncbi:hypothetical protein J7F03_34975 [Streptomyces sp. ISL-43]|nr:hypothetical protein [Streptomyces sp. ISL-43]